MVVNRTNNNRKIRLKTIRTRSGNAIKQRKCFFIIVTNTIINSLHDELIVNGERKTLREPIWKKLITKESSEFRALLETIRFRCRLPSYRNKRGYE